MANVMIFFPTKNPDSAPRRPTTNFCRFSETHNRHRDDRAKFRERMKSMRCGCRDWGEYELSPESCIAKAKLTTPVRIQLVERTDNGE